MNDTALIYLFHLTDRKERCLPMFEHVRRMVEDAGYDGMREVEIFSARDWWRRDPEEVIATIKERYRTAV